MKRTLATLLAVALLVALPTSAQAAFGLHDLDVFATAEDGGVESRAGAHPFALTTEFAVDTEEDEVLEFEVPQEDFRSLAIEVPEGFVADRAAAAQCTIAEFSGGGSPECTKASAVGTVTVELSSPDFFVDSLVYNLTPPKGAVARLGFEVIGVPVTIDLGLTQEPPYRGVASISNALQVFPVYSSEFTLWGVPADEAHDAERGGSVDGAELPFLTMPRSCTGPLQTTVSATSWQGSSFEETIESHGDGGEPLGMVDCQPLGFGPKLSAQTTNRSAESPTGIDVELEIDDPELINPTGRAASDIKKAVVTLPEGMTANPSIAEGLGTCSEADLARERIDSEPGEGCPQSSKVGTIEVESPLLEDVLLKGQLFIATQGENPFGSLLALYIVLRDPELGILVKLPGKIEPHPQTGQLLTTFGEAGFEIPQLPLSHVRFHFREGARSPLITPPSCGTHITKAQFTPWANPATTFETTASFQITSGVGGGDCPPPGTPPFEPGLGAGTVANDAASYSPFHLRLTRRDGDQDLTRFSFELPPGMTANLSGVSQCPDAAIALAKTKTGRAELASQSCPANSQIGSLRAGAGVGSQLTYVPGKIYLAPPYNGAPLSVVAIVPAVAGPFDVGTVVTRQALDVDPRSATALVDGSRSDPIPHILAGIPLKVRDVRAYVDRPRFTLNPTNCDPFKVSAKLWGGGADQFSSADDAPVNRSAPFQATNCAKLGFKPKLTINLKGGTKRGGHPALKAIVTPRAGDANFAQATVTLPRSAFLDQAHIRTICTRVQFAAESCPKGAIYGFAKATTPILDEPAEGPVYLRSSNHNLPDLVMALKGPPQAAVDVELVGRIDSNKGGIRTTFEAIPDLPVTKFILTMQGGKKGLIVNSRDLCARPSRATARLKGQNGRRHNSNPVVVAAGCAKQARR